MLQTISTTARSTQKQGQDATKTDRREYLRNYYLANRERAREYQRNYNLTHRKKAKAGKVGSVVGRREVRRETFTMRDIMQNSTEKSLRIISQVLSGDRSFTM